jgi:beta-lactamase superfamily II metal-dependent hydrolase
MGLIVVNDNIKSVHLKKIRLQILGPTKKNLDKLREEWNNWFSKKQQTQKSAYELVQILDKSIPNLASIMFWAHIKNRKILFTGNGLGQDIIQILSKNAMIDKNGKFHVDVLKVPHHGSDRNVSKEFFDIVSAEYYIISANGMYDNPSHSTLKWIIESEHFHKKLIKIVVTNQTPVIRKILDEYEAKKFKYECLKLKDKNNLTIKLK